MPILPHSALLSFSLRRTIHCVLGSHASALTAAIHRFILLLRQRLFVTPLRDTKLAPAWRAWGGRKPWKIKEAAEFCGGKMRVDGSSRGIMDRGETVVFCGILSIEFTENTGRRFPWPFLSRRWYQPLCRNHALLFTMTSRFIGMPMVVFVSPFLRSCFLSTRFSDSSDIQYAMSIVFY